MSASRHISAEGNHCLHLEGEMTIYTAAEQLAELRLYLLEPGELTLDLSEVSELDSAGLQLLLLAEREGRLAGRPLTVVNHSSAVRDTLALCNLDALLGALDAARVDSSAC